MANSGKRWLKSKTQGLVKCARTGKYFARARVGGPYKYESLKTHDYEVALNRLAKFRERVIKMRKAIKRQANKITVATLLDELESLTNEDEDLKKTSKTARLNSIKRIRTSWPDLAKISPIALTYDDVKRWADRLKRDGTAFTPPGASVQRSGNSSSSVNKAVGVLGKAMDIAVKKGLVLENVARMEGLRMKESYKDVRVPSRSEFEAILAELKASSKTKIKHTHMAAYCAEFIACSGCRIAEAARITFADVDFDSKAVRVRGTKTDSSDRVIPMGDQLEKLICGYLEEVKAIAKQDTPKLRVFPLDSINKHLSRACEVLGIERITNHSLRHYFGTTCLEAGIPAHTVAAWLGHKDGGALLLKIYAHHRDQHSREAIRSVKF